jgi:nitroimidazol reductase NimA-like FMN-containing flavoprotein (pyridoxamine 5'-phosphate oxidase superfamily)
MRRADRQITDIFEIESILTSATVCRIGLADANEPYIVPVCFGYRDKKIYFHSAASGKKISMLERNSRCCFEVDRCDSLIRSEKPCAVGIRYSSVIGFGRAHLISDNKEKKQGLNCILCHYGFEICDFSDDDLKNVCIIRIDIDSITGKRCD